MPTLNSRWSIDEALESLERQSNKNFELIICDGGSTDGTLDILATRLQGKVRVISLSDLGVPDALNKGFYAAKGEILCWMNSDDVIVSVDALERVRLAFENNETMVAIGNSIIINLDGVVEKTLISFAPNSKYINSGGNIFTGSLFFRKRVWSDFGGFAQSYRFAFEYELTDAIFELFPVTHLDVLIGGFRIHEAGLSSRFRGEMDQEIQRLRMDKNLCSKSEQKMNRFLRHIFDFTILRVLVNKYYDRNRGKVWWEL
jgi:glycosyltransferase involved in cell wall biosynthesis